MGSCCRGTLAPVLTGRCNCGAVRFEIDEALGAAGYCHCTRCQRRTGGASSAQAALAPGSLRLVAGEDVLRAWKPEDGYAKVFCSQCGSHVFSGPRPDDYTTVRLGVIDGDPGVRPSYRQRLESAATWEPVPDDGLERFDGPR
jgi:hypothetical protein